jgi:hypothetical protein
MPPTGISQSFLPNSAIVANRPSHSIFGRKLEGPGSPKARKLLQLNPQVLHEELHVLPNLLFRRRIPQQV